MSIHRLPTLAALALALFAVAARAADFTVTERVRIFAHPADDPKDPANTSGFNHAPNLVRLPDGRILAAWYSCPYEGAPSQRIVAAHSADEGRTWSAPETVQDFPGRADFDPSFVSAGKSTFLFFAADRPISIYMRRSEDSGKTWGEAVSLGQPEHTTRASGIQLATGELLVPLHERGTKAGGVLKSTDGGASWTRFGKVANPDGNGGEPTIAQLKSGAIHMILRTKDGALWRAQSTDRGETWSTPEKTGLTGTPSASHLLSLRDGTLVLASNPGPPPLRLPLQLRASRDGGATWGEPTVLADRPENVAGWQVSYPSLIELPDGTLLAVWTQIRAHGGKNFGDIWAGRVTLRLGN